MVIQCYQGARCSGNWLFTFLGYLSTAENHVQPLKIPSLKITILRCSFFFCPHFCTVSLQTSKRTRQDALKWALCALYLAERFHSLQKSRRPAVKPTNETIVGCWTCLWDATADIVKARYSLFSDCTAHRKLPSSVTQCITSDRQHYVI